MVASLRVYVRGISSRKRRSVYMSEDLPDVHTHTYTHTHTQRERERRIETGREGWQQKCSFLYTYLGKVM